jgi:hypothetical protein
MLIYVASALGGGRRVPMGPRSCLGGLGDLDMVSTLPLAPKAQQEIGERGARKGTQGEEDGIPH